MARGQNGQALVELALTSLVLILIMFGAVDLARVYNAQTALQEASRVGARHGALFDPNGKVNPFLCDSHAASPATCPSTKSTFTSTDGIKEVVDKALLGAGLPASTLKAGCPGGPTPYNGPYVTEFASMGTTVGQPWLYICYDTTAGTGGPISTPAVCGSSCGGQDMEVVVLMQYPLVITGAVGPTVQLVGNSHVRVQGT